MRRLAFLLMLLLALPAFGAVDTTTVQGTVVTPAGMTATAGTIMAILSQAGTALDGTTQVAVAGWTSGTIGSNGAVTGLKLVPNDAITPAGTYYSVTIVVTAPIRTSWQRKWSITTAPDPIDIGAITVLDAAPGITVGNYAAWVAGDPTGTSCVSGLAAPTYSESLDQWCDCQSNIFVCFAAPGGGGLSGLTATRVPFALNSTTLGDDPGFIYDSTNDRLTLGTAYRTIINGTQTAPAGFDASASMNMLFDKAEAASGSNGIGFSRNGHLRWAFGEDYRIGTRSYFAIWSDLGDVSGGQWISGDIMGIGWGGADSAGMEGPKWYFNGSFADIGGPEYDAPYFFQFGAPSLRTTGNDPYAALFNCGDSGTNSGGVRVNVSGTTHPGLIINNMTTTNRYAGIQMGRYAGASFLGYELVTDVAKNNTQSWSIYDNVGSAVRVHLNSTGDFGIGTTSVDNPLVVRRDQNLTTRIAVYNATSGTGSAAGFYAGDASTGNSAGLFRYDSAYTGDPALAGNAMVSASGATSSLFFGTVGAKKVQLDPTGDLTMLGAGKFVGPLTGNVTGTASDLGCTGCVAASELGANIVGTDQTDYSLTQASNAALDNSTGQCAFDATDNSNRGFLICRAGGTAAGRSSLLTWDATAGVGTHTTALPLSPAGTTYNIPAIEKASTWSGKQTFNAGADFATVAPSFTVAPTLSAGASFTTVRPTFSVGPQLAVNNPILWPTAAPSATSGIRTGTLASTFNSVIDNIHGTCYNCSEDLSTRNDAAEHMFSQTTEYSYYDTGSSEAVEHNWQYISKDGGTTYRPFAYFLRVLGTGLHSSQWVYTTAPSEQAFKIRAGGVTIGNGSDGSEVLDVYGTSKFTGAATYQETAIYAPSYTMTGAVDKNALTVAPSANSTDTTNTPELNQVEVTGSLTLSTTNAKAKHVGIYSNPKTNGSATGNAVSGLIGFQSIAQTGSTGTGTTYGTIEGVHAEAFLLGSNWHATTVCLFCSDGTLFSLPSGASADNGFGLHIPNLAGVGTANHAILVDSQSGADAAKGNLTLAGGAYNTGHLVLGSTHLWQEAAGTFAIKNGAPASAADGSRLVVSARSSTSGPAAWAADTISCATACTNIGQANCADSIPLDGTNTALGNCTGTTGNRMCECY